MAEAGTGKARSKRAEERSLPEAPAVNGRPIETLCRLKAASGPAALAKDGTPAGALAYIHLMDANWVGATDLIMDPTSFIFSAAFRRRLPQ